MTEERRARCLEAIQQLRLMDDTFMNVVFKDKGCAEQLIRIIIEKDLVVIRVDTQYTIGNLYGRGVRLDIFAEDTLGNLYNIEVQNNKSGAIPKRARYNSSLIDANFSIKGDDWSSLPETYVIFITETDVLGGNKPIYHIDRSIKELGGRTFEDKAHIIYINSKIKDDTDLGRLMQDFYRRDPKDIDNKVLAKRVSALKNIEEEGEIMCEIMNKLIEEETASVRREKEELQRRLEEKDRALEAAAEEKETAVREITEQMRAEAERKTQALFAANERIRAEKNKAAEEKRKAEEEKREAEAARRTSAKSIDTLMSVLGWTADEAMEQLGIPKKDHSMYFQMLSRK